MPYRDVIWIAGPGGNVQHIAEHDIAPQEVEQVRAKPDEVAQSRSSGRPVAFGCTDGGRYLAVVHEVIDDATVYPITAFGVPE